MPPAEDAHYVPPWANTSIIGISGASGSGKTSLAVEIVSSLNLPWVVILSMVHIAMAVPGVLFSKFHAF